MCCPFYHHVVLATLISLSLSLSLSLSPAHTHTHTHTKPAIPLVLCKSKIQKLNTAFSRNTNKMQLCNRIYYSKVYLRLNMFRAAHRSSSGALNCVCSLWFIYPCGDRPLPRLSGKSIHPFPTQPWLQTQFRAPDDEQCAARNMFSLQ